MKNELDQIDDPAPTRQHGILAVQTKYQVDQGSVFAEIHRSSTGHRQRSDISEVCSILLYPVNTGSPYTSCIIVSQP